MVYYNEIDKFAAAGLRELIKAGHIAQGEVDERSIEDVKPSELRGYTQHHFFAGIGIWSYALRQAGWPDTREVVTGSCPCQPFSTAGKRTGTADERHLWPAWFHLIEKLRPSVVFGEQVEAAIRQGWLDLVQTDMEGLGYAFGPLGLCAAGFGAPHIRARIYFVADSTDIRREQRRDTTSLALQGQSSERSGKYTEPEYEGQLARRPQGLCGTSSNELADSRQDERRSTGSIRREFVSQDSPEWTQETVYDQRRSEDDTLADPQSERRYGSKDSSGENGRSGLEDSSNMGDTDNSGPQGYGGFERQFGEEIGEAKERHSTAPGLVNGFWGDAEWVYCTDEKYRPVKPGIEPLVNGTTNRVGRLSVYGNALVAPVAEAFIRAYMEAKQ